ncbi:MAG: 50S ribosomal protein L15 [Sandaracinaceae bacterium]|jgi:large subunit ribosomal protein L15|nr:50S ribosomal protein L15 [Sandaracinaceae bacterium]MBK7152665.1 50S ribosomal protein L15 [Sandaracinaceae bacterium]MBK8412915.1 50S ribosomal protein L15 [Sandaracinaceae bacterium]MBK8588088.1 50S ribosomal protein L15 [Sandaracinaceae bacterium]
MADEQNQSEKDIPILSRLRAPIGAVRNKKRKGRGIGKLGKTAGKGMKGQKARSPGNFQKLGFEGGQMPLYRRLPKRGFHNIFAKDFAEVNVRDLARFDAGSVVDEAALREKRLVSGKFDGIKLLGNGELDRKLTLKVHAVSEGAKAKVEAAGGSVEILGG